ncbi:MAG: tetratricopeptide repeat protein [Pseudomonadota bacterium]
MQLRDHIGQVSSDGGATVSQALLVVAIAAFHVSLVTTSVQAKDQSKRGTKQAEETNQIISAAMRLALAQSRRQLRQARSQCDTHQHGTAQGDLQSRIGLANCFKSGIGRPKSLLRAQRLFEVAARMGSAEAHLALGQFLRDGRIITRNITEAANHFRSAAQNGLAEAMVELGLILRRENLEQQTACDWFARAAEHGNSNAIRLLGDCHAEAAGQHKDKSRAMELYRRSAGLGDYTASLKLNGHDFRGVGSNIAAIEGCAWAAEAAARYNQAASKAHAYCLSLRR